MKIFIAQQDYIIGDFRGNSQKIIAVISEAKNQKADLVVFPEMAVCGHYPYELLKDKNFIFIAQKFIDEIAEHCTNIAVVIGNIVEKEGKLFNSALFIINRQVMYQVNKQNLIDNELLDESRYFYANKEFNIIEYFNQRIAITVGNDIEYFQKEVDLIINISAISFDYDNVKSNFNKLQNISKKLNSNIVFVNQVGGQVESIYAGASCAFNSEGKLLNYPVLFEEAAFLIDTKSIVNDFVIPEKIALIRSALVLGVRDYFRKMGFKKAVIGMSGGIDSALCLAIASEAIGAENVHCILMPSKYSSDHSINDSLEMINIWGNTYDIIPIQNIVDKYIQEMSQFVDARNTGLTGENLQARIRGNILMAYSNKFGHIVLNTSNKSEVAVGFGTLYGDMCGSLAVIADVYKTEVYELARFLNRNGIVISQNIIDKVPSAELAPNQKDSDRLPDYNILDLILKEYIENLKTEDEIINLGFDAETVNRTIKLIKNNEFKRYQSAPLIKVSPKSLAMKPRIALISK